jgi:WD40 repeat protein
VRVWDCWTYSCVSIIHPNPAPLKDSLGPCTLPLDEPMQLLACARSPGNTCVCFDAGGSWLLIGNAEGYLVLWNVRLQAAVAHTQCLKSGGEGSSSAVVVPQVR